MLFLLYNILYLLNFYNYYYTPPVTDSNISLKYNVYNNWTDARNRNIKDQLSFTFKSFVHKLVVVWVRGGWWFTGTLWCGNIKAAGEADPGPVNGLSLWNQPLRTNVHLQHCWWGPLGGSGAPKGVWRSFSETFCSVFIFFMFMFMWVPLRTSWPELCSWRPWP